MKRYALFDEQGFPKGFFSDDVHGARLLPVYGEIEPDSSGGPSDAPMVDWQPNPDCLIPAEAVEITHDQWVELLSFPAARQWKDGELVTYAPPPPIVDLNAYAAQKRWEKEVGGIEINGLTVATDDRSKTMISGARVSSMANPNFTTAWKGSGGEFVPLDASAVVAISDAVLAHVSNCFAIEAQVLADILAGAITTVEQIDAAFHGSNDG